MYSEWRKNDTDKLYLIKNKSSEKELQMHFFLNKMPNPDSFTWMPMWNSHVCRGNFHWRNSTKFCVFTLYVQKVVFCSENQYYQKALKSNYMQILLRVGKCGADKQAKMINKRMQMLSTSSWWYVILMAQRFYATTQS